MNGEESKIKRYIAEKLNKYTNLFCWADLVSWFMYSKSTKELLQYRNDVKGCQVDGKESACYCGKYMKPELRAEIQEANKKPLTNF